MNRPNVVLLISHDTGKFYSPYGVTTLDTPNFDALARQSVVFDRCFCTTPLCAPARAALVTGRYPHQNGMNGLTGETLGSFDLVEKDRHLAHVLRSHGYRTLLSGFEHETVDLFNVGFEDCVHGCGSTNNGGKNIPGTGLDLDEWFGRHPGAGAPDRPFYLQIGCGETHRDWDSAIPHRERGVWKAPYLKDLPEVDTEMALMQGSCRTLDAGLGEIMAVFERRGLARNTLFVVTTDHGIDFPRAKGTLFDPGVEVGLFMRWDAGGWAHGRRCPSLASHVDVYATLLEACGVPAPAGTEGQSLMACLRDPEDAPPPRDAVFLEKTYHDNYDPMRAIRTGRFKYVFNFDAQTMYDVRVATAPRYGWFRTPFIKSRREELYDLASDPHEIDNLAGREEYEELRRTLRRRLAEWMRDTGDPLLDGPMPSPYHQRACQEMRELAGGGAKKH